MCLLDNILVRYKSLDLKMVFLVVKVQVADCLNELLDEDVSCCKRTFLFNLLQGKQQSIVGRITGDENITCSRQSTVSCVTFRCEDIKEYLSITSKFLVHLLTKTLSSSTTRKTKGAARHAM